VLADSDLTSLDTLLTPLLGVAYGYSLRLLQNSAEAEDLLQEGKHSPLDDEIRTASGVGSAAVLFESGALWDFGDSLVATVRVDADHPMVSLVAMIAPSPDWFTGVANVNLMENGSWVASRSLELWAYDSGGDDGTTYKAPDQEIIPKSPRPGPRRGISRPAAPRSPWGQ
jgi:hypothetical protein